MRTNSEPQRPDATSPAMAAAPRPASAPTSAADAADATIGANKPTASKTGEPAAGPPAPVAGDGTPAKAATGQAGKPKAPAEKSLAAAATSAVADAGAGDGPQPAAATRPGSPAGSATPAPRPPAARGPGVAAPPQAPTEAQAPAAVPGAAPSPGQAPAHARPMQQSGRPMPPPRPLAKAENFVQGDHVVYPTHGVGKVERIAVEEIAGHKLELIHITFEENRMTLRVPVAKARTAGLRKLATRSLFDDALAVLKGKARIKRTMWSRRAQEYEAKINSGDPLAIAEVVRDLHRNAGQPDQSFSERQIYEAAMDRLAAELAALDQTDKPTAAIKLAEFLKTV